MENNSGSNAWYIARNGSIPVLVHPVTISSELHLYDESRNRLASFPVNSIHIKSTGDDLALLLNEQQGAMLHLSITHPLAIQFMRKSQPRKGARARLFTALGILVIAIIGIYFLFVSLVPYIGLRLVSPQQETALGNRLYEFMISDEISNGASIDTAASNRLQVFADHMGMNTNFPIRITVIRSPVFNAYALPGGHMVVYSGILQKLNTPESLAALLAHERSHINGRHSLRSLLRKASTAILVATLFGDGSGIMTAIASNAETIYGLSYARHLEKEADSEGMQLLVDRNIDPAGMVQLMKEMEKADGAYRGNSLLSTHPHTGDRRKWAAEFIKEQPSRNYNNSTLYPQFRAVKDALAGERGQGW